MNLTINRKLVILVLILVVLILSFLIWFNEEGTNNEVPKKAIFVMNIKKESGEYRQRTNIYDFKR